MKIRKVNRLPPAGCGSTEADFEAWEYKKQVKQERLINKLSRSEDDIYLDRLIEQGEEDYEPEIKFA